jgi:hypothetical protein
MQNSMHGSRESLVHWLTMQPVHFCRLLRSLEWKSGEVKKNSLRSRISILLFYLDWINDLLGLDDEIFLGLRVGRFEEVWE